MDSKHEYTPDKVYHPSETLRGWVAASDLPATDISELQAKTLHVLQGADVDKDSADDLEALTGVDASFWLNLQRKYDEVHGDD